MLILMVLKMVWVMYKTFSGVIGRLSAKIWSQFKSASIILHTLSQKNASSLMILSWNMHHWNFKKYWDRFHVEKIINLRPLAVNFWRLLMTFANDLQLTLHILNSDISNSSKLEASIQIKNTFWLFSPTTIWLWRLFYKSKLPEVQINLHFG